MTNINRREEGENTLRSIAATKVSEYKSGSELFLSDTYLQFEIWAGFGPTGQFRVHEFIALFINILSRI